MSKTEKIFKPIIKTVGAASLAAISSDFVHRIREANTRKKAMDAAVRENNKRAKKNEKSEEE